MYIKKVISWILVLIFIDQVIKIIINTYFFELRFIIVKDVFEFRPIFNAKGTYLLNLLNLNIKKCVYDTIYLVSLCIVIVFYVFLRKAKNNTILFDFVFIFFVAGLICAMIGNMFWIKGCLDYIYLKPLFVFDIKDLYITMCIILLFIFFYQKRIKTFKDLLNLTKM